MDIAAAVTEIEAALHRQLELAADDPDITEAAAALMAVLEPALRRAGTTLAEQAALEVEAQLPDHRVSVVLSDGEPQLRVQRDEPAFEFTTAGKEARLTLRLPDALKARLEEAAGEEGDSINSFVVDALARRTTSARSSRGNRVSTSIDL